MSWDYTRVPEHTASVRAHQPKADDGVGVDRASASTRHHVERIIPVRNGRVAWFSVQEEAGHGECVVDRVGHPGLACIVQEFVACTYKCLLLHSTDPGVLDTEYQLIILLWDVQKTWMIRSVHAGSVNPGHAAVKA